MSKCGAANDGVATTGVCSKCNSDAVIYSKKKSKSENINYCADCFKEYIEQKIAACVDDYHLMEPGDIVGVGVSGGKDSQFLLHVLLKLQKRIAFEIKCFMVDEGIKNYREFGIEILQNYLKEKGLKLYSSTMKKEYGYEVDEFVENYQKLNSGKKFRVCSICDPTRINIVKKLAIQEGCNKVALGINLDDHLITTLVAIRSASMMERMLQTGPKYRFPKSKLEYILPLSTVTDKEINIYNLVEEIPYQTDPSCPYAETCLDEEYRKIVYNLEDISPGYREAVIANLQKFKEHIKVDESEWKYCNSCMEGYYSVSTDVCLDCSRYENLRKKAGY